MRALNGHWMPEGQEEMGYLHAFIFLMLASLTITFDKASHAILYSLKPSKRGAHNKDDEEHSNYTNELSLMIFNRAQGELTVLGFLAFTIWMLNQAKVFDLAASFAYRGHEDSSHDAASTHEAASSHDEPEHSHRRLAELTFENIRASIGHHLPSNCMHMNGWLPTDGGSMLHIAEDIHVNLFLTMLAYFIILRCALFFVVRRLNAYSAYENRARSGEAERSSVAQHVKNMQRHLLLYLITDKEAVAAVNSVPDDIRAREVKTRKILSAAAARVSANQMTPDQLEALERELHVSIPGFLSSTMFEDIDQLIEFPSSSWALIILYAFFVLVALQLTCGRDGVYYLILISADAVWFYGTAYLSLRLFVHQIRLQRLPWTFVKGVLKPHSLWPAAFIDRLFVFSGPGFTGFVPWKSKPSEKLGLLFLQATMFFQLYILLETSTEKFSAEPGDLSLFDDGHLYLVKWFTMIFWIIWILPGLLEVFAQPPFVTTDELELLLENIHPAEPSHVFFGLVDTIKVKTALFKKSATDLV